MLSQPLKLKSRRRQPLVYVVPTIAPSFTLVYGHDATYNMSPDGNTTVTIRNAAPINFREIYVGTAHVGFGLYYARGGGRQWSFTPWIMAPKPAQYTERIAEDGKTQFFTVELGNNVFPASGFVDVNIIGSLFAPAIHFDVPHGYDLWVFLLRSPWSPLKLQPEKPVLNIAHGSAQATAQIEAVYAPDGGQTLRADVSLHGEGFKQVSLILERTQGAPGDFATGIFSAKELLCQISEPGTQTCTWKPTTRDFNVTLVSYSFGDQYRFIEFLKYLGAPVEDSTLTLPANFPLCDGPNLTYHLSLVGEKNILSHEKDEAIVRLKA